MCFFIVFSLAACDNSDASEPDDEELEKRPIELEDQPTVVVTILAEHAPFYKELIANGKLEAVHRADLHFQIPGNIVAVEISEGQSVAKGQVLARLDDIDQQTIHTQLLMGREKALLDYEDHLLRLGYRMQDTAQLDPAVKRIARLRSGLLGIENDLAKNVYEMGKNRLVAPFAGRIANLKMRPYNHSSSFEYACTLVGLQEFFVEFKILEQELSVIRVGNTIQVTPFSGGNTYTGTISGITPLVDASGMVNIKAKIKNDGKLLDGMSVKVTTREQVGQMISVPKEAVLDRQDRKVVFTLKNGLAQWNYVEIVYENSTHYAISAGLEIGDEIIYQGNFNLAHDKKVVKSDSINNL